MSLVGVVVSSGHAVFGVFFLVIVADEAWRRLRRSWSGRSALLVPAAFLVSGVAMWIATIRANTANEYLVHSLWADVLLVVGAVEWARRSGRLGADRWGLVQPLGFLVGGALLFVHLHGSLADSSGALWHALMGGALFASGLLDVAAQVARPGRRGWMIAAEAPLVAFVVLLLTFPG